MKIINGQVDIVTNGLVTTISNSHNAILEWNKFNINHNEIVKFIQESSNSAVLNRVLGGSVSQILGQLQSNGKVFIVNPAGIVFGATAQVNVASLVASTLDISNEDFIQGNYVFNQDKDKAIAQVLNQGLIKVNDDGTLALVGGQVVNSGTLEAKNGTVYLLAGHSITIQDLENPLISYKVTANNKAVNLGEIVSKRTYLLANKVVTGYTTAEQFADVISSQDSARKATITASGEVVLYGASESELVQDTSYNDAMLTANYTCQSGLVVVNGTIMTANETGKAGSVNLLGDVVALENNAVVNASGNQGGEVFIGGDLSGKGEKKLAAKTIMQTEAVVNVSGTEGDAGTAIAWGNIAYFDGTFYAKSVYGDGGFIETSGDDLNLFDNIYVDTSSNYGSAGNWLIDPMGLLIVNSTVGAGNVNSLNQDTYVTDRAWDGSICSSNHATYYVNDLASMTSSTTNYTVNPVRSGKYFSLLRATSINEYLNRTNVTLQARGEILFYYLNNEINTTNGATTLILNGNISDALGFGYTFLNSNVTLKGNIEFQNPKSGSKISFINSTITANCFTFNTANSTSPTENPVQSNVYITNSTLTATSNLSICVTGHIYICASSTINGNHVLVSAYSQASNVTINGSGLYATHNLTIGGNRAINISNNDTKESVLRGNYISVESRQNNTTILINGTVLNTSTTAGTSINIGGTAFTGSNRYGNISIENTTFRDAGNVNINAFSLNVTRSVSYSVGDVNFKVVGNQGANVTNNRFEARNNINITITPNVSTSVNGISNSSYAFSNTNLTAKTINFYNKYGSLNVTNVNFSASDNFNGNITTGYAVYDGGTNVGASKFVNSIIKANNTYFNISCRTDNGVSTSNVNQDTGYYFNWFEIDGLNVTGTNATFNATNTRLNINRLNASLTGNASFKSSGNVVVFKDSATNQGTKIVVSNSTVNANYILANSGSSVDVCSSNFSATNTVTLWGQKTYVSSSNLSANSINISIDQEVSISGSNLSVTTGDLLVTNSGTAGSNFWIDIRSSKLQKSSAGNITLRSLGRVYLENTEILGTNDTVDSTSGVSVNVYSGINLTATGANIASYFVNLTTNPTNSSENISLFNSCVTALGSNASNRLVLSTNGVLNLNNTNITTQGNITLGGNNKVKDVNITNGSCVTSVHDNVTLTTGNSSNLNSFFLESSTLKAKNNVSVYQHTTCSSAVNISRANLLATKDVVVNITSGDLNFNNSNLTAGVSVNVKANQGNFSFKNSNATVANTLTFYQGKALGLLDINNSNLTSGTGDLNLCTSSGTIKVTDSNVTSNAKINFSALVIEIE
ncbi:beta strand repeat-containing protein, partial [Psittacicella gerlachiana]